MDGLSIASDIKEVIKAIKVEGTRSADLIEAKACANRDYDRELAVHILKLKQDHPVTVVEKLAKGECADLKYKLEVAESGYKAHFARLDYLKAQLNGLQSMNRHLDSFG